MNANSTSRAGWRHKESLRRSCIGLLESNAQQLSTAAIFPHTYPNESAKIDTHAAGLLDAQSAPPRTDASCSVQGRTYSFSSICQLASQAMLLHSQRALMAQHRYLTAASPSTGRPCTIAHGPNAVLPSSRTFASVAATELHTNPSLADARHSTVFHAAAPAAARLHREHAPEATLYKVEIVTGDKRGAGTPCPAIVRMVGTSSTSEPFILGEDGSDTQTGSTDEGVVQGFPRGSTRTYLLSIDTDLGDIQRIEVEQMQSTVSELGTGWYLERLDLTLPNGERLTFPCGHWIGKSDETNIEGPKQRNLIPCCVVRRPMQVKTGLPIVVAASAMAVPHPEKVADGRRAVNRRGGGYGGEDAYFYCATSTGQFALGVADGIYSWRTMGIDSGEYSRGLLQHVKSLVEEGHTDVLSILQEAERRLRTQGTQGSSTVCIVLIDMAQGRLTSANLGDSGFLVLGSTPSERHLHVKYRSPQQEHEFGYPFQLGHQENADRANDAILMTLPVIPGDIIILGSDGLFDNVSDGEVVTIAEQLLRENCCTPSELARCLLHNAYHNSLDRHKATPYSMAATEVFDMVYSGGKMDDISVVVAKLDARAGVPAATSSTAAVASGLHMRSERR